MKKKIKKEPTGFTQISNKLLNNEKLSFRAKGLYSFLYSKPDNWDFSGDRIAKQGKDGRKAIYATLKELERSNFIKRIKQGTGRMVYYLLIKPFDQKGQQAKNKAIKPNAPKGKVPKGQSAQRGSISNKDSIVIKKKNSNKELTPKEKMIKFINKPEIAINPLIKKGIDKNLAESEIMKFYNYWTEPTKSGKKQRWELQPTFDVGRRLATWFNNINKYSSRQRGGVAVK